MADAGIANIPGQARFQSTFGDAIVAAKREKTRQEEQAKRFELQERGLGLQERSVAVSEAASARAEQKLPFEIQALQRRAQRDEFDLMSAAQKKDLTDQAIISRRLIRSGATPQEKVRTLQIERDRLVEDERDTSSIDKAIQVYGSGDQQAIADFDRLLASDVQIAEDIGIIGARKGTGSEFERLLPKAGLTPQETQDITRERVGTIARGGPDPSLTGERETSKLEAQKKLKPELAADIKRSEKFEETRADRIEALPKARFNMANLEDNTEFVENKIEETKQLINEKTDFGRVALKNLPLSDWKAITENLETIKANIGFDKLQAMRQASKTGGALGQVSEFENRLLQATQGSLDQNQPTDRLLGNLDTIKDQRRKLLNNQRVFFGQEYRDLIGAEGIPQAAIDFLLQNPDKAQDFDAKYGFGASKQILGQ